MASHGHGGSATTVSLDGYLSTENTYKNNGPAHQDGGGIVQLEGSYNAYRASGDSDKNNPRGRNLHLSASHSHSITISAIGGNTAHENRQPFTVVNRWRRTA
jgi:hypothetical protein